MFAVIISILLLIMAIVAFIIARKVKPVRIVANLMALGALVLTIIIMVTSCMSQVPTGHTGILTTFGRVEDVSLGNGLNFHKPWQNVVTMTNKEQKFTEANVSFSKDLQEVTYTYTVKYNLLPNAATKIYKTFLLSRR